MQKRNFEFKVNGEVLFAIGLHPYTACNFEIVDGVETPRSVNQDRIKALIMEKWENETDVLVRRAYLKFLTERNESYGNSPNGLWVNIFVGGVHGDDFEIPDNLPVFDGDDVIAFFIEESIKAIKGGFQFSIEEGHFNTGDQT